MARPRANRGAPYDVESASGRRRSANRRVCACISMLGSVLAGLGVVAIIIAFFSMGSTTLPRFAFQSLPIDISNPTSSIATINVGNPNSCNFYGIEARYNVSYIDHVLRTGTISPINLGPRSIVSVETPMNLFDLDNVVHDQLGKERDNEVAFDVVMQVKASTDAPYIELTLKNFYVTCRVRVSNLTESSEIIYSTCDSHY